MSSAMQAGSTGADPSSKAKGLIQGTIERLVGDKSSVEFTRPPSLLSVTIVLVKCAEPHPYVCLTAITFVGCAACPMVRLRLARGLNAAHRAEQSDDERVA
jgi:hypothetical protein